MLAERIEKDAFAAADAEAPCKLLIADDQPHILEALRLLLKPEGYQLEMVRMPALVLEALAHESFDGVLIDLNYTRDTTSGQEGLDLVTRVKEMDAQLPVVVMTAWGNIDLAVEAMRRGAGDFIQKPWENARLLSILRTQMESAPQPEDEHSGWRQRIVFYGRRVLRILSLLLHRCGPSLRRWREWDRRTRMC